jgi:hypothetical protein
LVWLEVVRGSPALRAHHHFSFERSKEGVEVQKNQVSKEGKKKRRLVNKGPVTKQEEEGVVWW